MSIDPYNSYSLDSNRIQFFATYLRNNSVQWATKRKENYLTFILGLMSTQLRYAVYNFVWNRFHTKEETSKT